MNWLLRAHAATITIIGNIPGPNNISTTGPSGFVANFYLYALLVSGLLAFGAIVYGGVKYATGRGNPTAESEGRSWITGALWGLLLLAGAYVLLRTINPNIVNLQLPTNIAPMTNPNAGIMTGPTPQ